MDPEDYRETVAKMDASLQKRTTREDQIEACLTCSMPGLLRRLMDDHDDRVRPALSELNDRLDEKGMDSNVSPNTFYDWLRKYRYK